MNFSIVGFGHIGKVHKAAIEQVANAKLISIVDVVPNMDDTGVLQYASLEDFLKKDKNTDVVCLATPNGLHAQQAIQCLQAGKHVIVEKPMALHVADAQKILDAADTAGKRVFSFLQLRFSPAVRFVKKLMDENKLGKIYLINIQCYWNRNENYYKSRSWSGSREMDGGVLFTQFSHFIDVVDYWMNGIKCISSQTFNFNHPYTEFPDSGTILFTAGNAAGSLMFTTATFNKNYESSITVIAEKGTVKVGDQYLNEIKYADITENSTLENISTEQKAFHANAVADAICAIETNQPSIIDGKNTLGLIRFIEDAYAE